MIGERALVAREGMLGTSFPKRFLDRQSWREAWVEPGQGDRENDCSRQHVALCTESAAALGRIRGVSNLKFYRTYSTRHDPQRAAAAALDLHWQRDHRKPLQRQLLEIRDVLKRGNILLKQNAMALE